jgi:replicative DNA helicase
MVKTLLPLDLEQYEKIIMFNSLMDQTYLETIFEHTKPSYFKDKDIKSVFTVLHSFYDENGKVPNVTELKAHLISEEDKQALRRVVVSFDSIDKNFDKSILIKNTERFLREKAVMGTVFSTSVDVQSGDIDSTKILKKFEQACNISLIENLGFDYLENIDKHVEDLQKVFNVLPTGWKWLDKHLGGGFMAEGRALYVFFGVTNVGKSIFLGNIATNVLNQGKTVLLISLEMPEQVYAKRISSSLTRIPSNDLNTHLQPLKTSLHQYKAKNGNAKLIIKEYPPKGVTVLNIKTYIKKLVNKGIKPDIIIIDYLNLIAPSASDQNSYEAVKQITESVRALSYEFECPVVSATQSNRSGYKEEKPDVDRTSESMGLAHTVDAQFSIWTDEKDFELGIIHMGIAKNRFGARNVHTQLKIDYPTLSLSELDDVVFNYTIKGETPTNIQKDSNPNISDILNSIENYSNIDEN